MDRKTKICIWVIMIGLGNFLAYTMLYMFLGGEAVNGWVTVDEGGHRTYYLLSGLASGRAVSLGEFLYSGIHSISIWPTVGAVLLAMLTLAKDRIVSSMRTTVVRGRTFITALATIIAFTVAVITVWFILQFASKLNNPQAPASLPMKPLVVPNESNR